MTTCVDVYTVIMPPQPATEDFPQGSNGWVKVIYVPPSSPPQSNPHLTGAVFLKTTICTEEPDPDPPGPPTGGYTPPGGGGGGGDMDFDPKEDEEENEYYEAPMPDTGGVEFDFEIEVPMDTGGESPEPTPIEFTAESIKTGGEIGESYVYAMCSIYSVGSTLYKINSSGEIVKTWTVSSEFSEKSKIVVVSDNGVVVFVDNDLGLCKLLNDEIVAIDSSVSGGSILGFDSNGDLYVQHVSSGNVLRIYDGTTLLLKSSKNMSGVIEASEAGMIVVDGLGNFFTANQEEE